MKSYKIYLKVKYYYEENQQTGEEKYTKIFAVVENN